MTALLITPRHLEAISRHAAMTYPEECCGILIGRCVEDSVKGSKVLVERILSVQNSRQDSRHNRYVIDPRTVLAAHREARAADLDVVGYYHSHPDHPAQPSDFDREHAWPGLSYLIVPVAKGVSGPPRAWRLTDDRSRFEEQALDRSILGEEDRAGGARRKVS